jgi:hypothetical protein
MEPGLTRYRRWLALGPLGGRRLSKLKRVADALVPGIFSFYGDVSSALQSRASDKPKGARS